MNRTKIETADLTWQIVTGCEFNCPYCWAHKLAHGRLRRFFPNGFIPTFHRERLYAPLRRKKPALIFVSSMGDLFSPGVHDRWIEMVLQVIRECPQHTFQLLTKNPQRMAEFDLPDNVWAGVSSEGGFIGYERIQVLHRTGARVNFISFEPLLYDPRRRYLDGIDWVIIGAQTGPGAVAPEPEWIEGLIAQARKVGAAVFLKKSLCWPETIQEWPAKPMEVLDVS